MGWVIAGLILVFAIAVSAVFMFGNSFFKKEVVCNEPYILVGTSCCLDQDDNNICDNDEITGSVTAESAVNESVETVLEPEKEEVVVDGNITFEVVELNYQALKDSLQIDDFVLNVTNDKLEDMSGLKMVIMVYQQNPFTGSWDKYAEIVKEIDEVFKTKSDDIIFMDIEPTLLERHNSMNDPTYFKVELFLEKGWDVLHEEQGYASLLLLTEKEKEEGKEEITTTFERHKVQEVGSELEITKINSISEVITIRLSGFDAEVKNPFIAVYRSSSSFPTVDRDAICAYLDTQRMSGMTVEERSVKEIGVSYPLDLCEGNLVYVELRSFDDPLKVYAADRAKVD